MQTTLLSKKEKQKFNVIKKGTIQVPFLNFRLFHLLMKHDLHVCGQYQTNDVYADGYSSV